MRLLREEGLREKGEGKGGEEGLGEIEKRKLEDGKRYWTAKPQIQIKCL